MKVKEIGDLNPEILENNYNTRSFYSLFSVPPYLQPYQNSSRVLMNCSYIPIHISVEKYTTWCEEEVKTYFNETGSKQFSQGNS